MLNADDVGSDIDMAITYKNMDALPALSIEKPSEDASKSDNPLAAAVDSYADLDNSSIEKVLH